MAGKFRARLRSGTVEERGNRASPAGSLITSVTANGKNTLVSCTGVKS